MGITSFTSFLASHPTQGDPGTHFEARHYMTGKNKFGNYINPCTWEFGITPGVNCSDVNPIFSYSGDPVTNFGWINNAPDDYRQLSNSGPFKLEVGKPVNIIIAHIAGRGYDALNSVTRTRILSNAIEEFYKSSFTSIPVSIDEVSELTPSIFQLYQNFPNPFNPTTNIEFRITDLGFVSLKVYDVLGNEIITLVNEEKPAGNYEVEFNASSLSSGIYFYELRTEKFSSVKKMILLK